MFGYQFVLCNINQKFSLLKLFNLIGTIQTSHDFDCGTCYGFFINDNGLPSVTTRYFFDQLSNGFDSNIFFIRPPNKNGTRSIVRGKVESTRTESDENKVSSSGSR